MQSGIEKYRKSGEEKSMYLFVCVYIYVWLVMWHILSLSLLFSLAFLTDGTPDAFLHSFSSFGRALNREEIK